jgi:uncharacterized protein (DUF2147 family)
MKNCIWLRILICLILSGYLSAEERVIGYWETSESIVEISECGDKLCGTIRSLLVEEGTNPESILDSNNIDIKLQSRPLVGVNILEGFNNKLDSNNKLKGGMIYNPRDGKVYKSKIYLLDDGNLRVEGCIFFICDGEEWKPLIDTLNSDDSYSVRLKNSLN